MPQSRRISLILFDGSYLYRIVTKPAYGTKKTFKVTSVTAVATPDGKPSQLLNLIGGTLVVVGADLGGGKVAAKIRVLPAVPEPR